MLTNPGSCQSVSGERIFATDLSRALPEFLALPKDTIIGYAPVPGARRFFQYPELKRIGTRYGVTVAPDSQACFEWKLKPVLEETVRSAILDSVHAPSSRVEIMAMSRGPAPDGKLEFPLSGLSISNGIDPATPVIWRGYILYNTKRKYSVWARVRISATMTRVVALQTLPPGEAVDAKQVRLETYDDFPLRNDIARNLEEVIGRVPRRTIRAGLPVFRTDLAEAYYVQRGEMVEVTAVQGAAQLELDAIAESSGRQGDVISLKNPRSGKTFRARIEGKGKAIVMSGISRQPVSVQ